MQNPNLLPLEDIASAITNLTGWKTSIEYPGYIHIHEKGISFGHSLDGEDYYTWNDEQGEKVGEVDSLPSARDVAIALREAVTIPKREILDEVNSILEKYSRLVGRFSHLYEQLDDETADLVTKAGEGKWLDYAFTESMDSLYLRSLSWELREQDLENKEA